MPQFRWPELKHDVLLAKEVAASRPSKPVDWEAIAGTLSVIFSTEEKAIDLKGRGCRERMERLLEKFKSEDSKSLKRLVTCSLVCIWFHFEHGVISRSGTEEDYSELTQLLQDIAEYQRDVLEAQIKEKKQKKRKEAEEKRQAEDMRTSAMMTMSSKYCSVHKDFTPMFHGNSVRFVVERKRRVSDSANSSVMSVDSDDEEHVDIKGIACFVKFNCQCMYSTVLTLSQTEGSNQNGHRSWPWLRSWIKSSSESQNLRNRSST